MGGPFAKTTFHPFRNLAKKKNKDRFKLYALCLISNHVHDLLEPAQPADLPRLMHWLNWYSARCFNRMLRRTGHFWERRYHGSGFARDDHVRALNPLRSIHGNPRAAGIQTSFFYRYSNDASYARLRGYPDNRVPIVTYDQFAR